MHLPSLLPLFSLLPLLPLIAAAPAPTWLVKRDVDTLYPYTGPAIPIGDLSDQTVQGNGNGKGYKRLRMPPAVTPTPGLEVTNNINVISTSYFPGGVNIHFQTPFGIGCEPYVYWGESPTKLKRVAHGYTHT
jgi:acid phosphatase